jgi:hypothetical protein
VDLLFYHCRLHRYVVFELKLGRFEPEYVGKLNFYVQLVDDHLRDQARDDPTLGMLLVVGRVDVTVEVALRGVSTPLAVTEWRRLPAKVRQALPTAEDLRPTVTRTVREIESTTPVALCRPEGAASSSSVRPLIRLGPGSAGALVDLRSRHVVSCGEFRMVAGARWEVFQFAAHLFPHAD